MSSSGTSAHEHRHARRVDIGWKEELHVKVHPDDAGGDFGEQCADVIDTCSPVKFVGIAHADPFDWPFGAERLEHRGAYNMAVVEVLESVVTDRIAEFTYDLRSGIGAVVISDGHDPHPTRDDDEGSTATGCILALAEYLFVKCSLRRLRSPLNRAIARY